MAILRRWTDSIGQEWGGHPWVSRVWEACGDCLYSAWCQTWVSRVWEACGGIGWTLTRGLFIDKALKVRDYVDEEFGKLNG